MVLEYQSKETNKRRPLQRWRRRLIAGVLSIVIVIALYRQSDGSPGSYSQQMFTGAADLTWRSEDYRSPRGAAGNSTLGFQAIYVLSRGTPWRLHGLRAAAAYTGITIEAPAQNEISQARLAAFQRPGKPDSLRPGDGSATAWLAHLDLIQRVVDTDLETALILEDDVDFDVAIREQMAGVSEAVRRLTKTSNEHAAGDAFGATTAVPYGREWDVLWIGHCGEDAGPSITANIRGAHRLEKWHDRTVVPHKRYIGWAHSAVNRLPRGSRAVLWAQGPVCTFAYALTRVGAAKVLRLADEGTDRAFDVKLASLCLDQKLKCLTVTPEILHEYVPNVGEDGVTASEVNAGNGQGARSKDGDARLESIKGSTANIVNSARCRALFDEACMPKG